MISITGIKCCRVDIRPLTSEMKLAGPAFTVPAAQKVYRKELKQDFHIIDILLPRTVSVWDCGGDISTGHWGELMTNTAINKKSQGAVIDGGIRDTKYIMPLGFPIFFEISVRKRCEGRVGASTPTRCPSRSVRRSYVPGDYVFGDADGIVVIPKEVTVQVLEKAEKQMRNETEIREGLRKGGKLFDLYISKEHRK